MKRKPEFSEAELEVLRQRLRDKPLVSSPAWMLRQVAYVVACIAALAAVIAFLDGTWRIAGLIVVGLVASGIPEVLVEWRYGNYRREWELANQPEAEE